MEQSFLGARKELRQSVASMESCLDVLTEIDNNDQPFDIAHLDMVKHIIPSDQDTDPMYDLNTSMEGLRESIKSSQDKIKDLVNRFKQRNRPPIHELKTPEALTRIREDLVKWKGETDGWVSIPYHYSGQQEAKDIIAAFEHDVKILESVAKSFRPLYDEMSKLSAQLCDEIDSEDPDEDLIDEIDAEIHTKLMAAKSKIEGIPKRANGETFKVTRHKLGVEVESIGTNKKWLENVRENDPVYVKVCNRQQAEALLALIERGTKVIESLPRLTLDYTQGELIWMSVLPYTVEDHIRSTFTYIQASINQKPRLTVSKESDTDFVANNGEEILHEDPLLLISRKLIQRAPIREGVLKLNTSYLGATPDKNGTHVLTTVKKSLPWILELAKGTTAYAKALRDAVANKVDPADVSVIDHFPLCRDQSGTDLSMTFTVEVADSIFEETVKIRCPRDRDSCKQYDLAPMSASEMSRIIHYIEQIRLYPVDRITSSDPNVDEIFLKSAVNALTQWNSHFIPELTKWMLASFGDPI